MNFEKNGVVLSIPDQVIVAFALGALCDAEREASIPSIQVMPRSEAPAIGEAWMGGIYAGIARGYFAEPDSHLIVGPDLGEAAPWDAMAERTKDLTAEGFSDWRLPTRKEQALQFANVPELFDQACYWSGEQHADGSRYAWLQYFGTGGQGTWGKGTKLRARAVRTIAVS